jgi:hypothetical protein
MTSSKEAACTTIYVITNMNNKVQFRFTEVKL